MANAQRHDPPQRLLLTLEPIGHTADPRKTWQYNRELRRILRPPNVAHDFRAFDVDNLRSVHKFEMFNGSPEHYEWSILEVYYDLKQQRHLVSGLDNRGNS